MTYMNTMVPDAYAVDLCLYLSELFKGKYEFWRDKFGIHHAQIHCDKAGSLINNEKELIKFNSTVDGFHAAWKLYHREDVENPALERLKLFCDHCLDEKVCATTILNAYLRGDITLEEADSVSISQGIDGPLMYWRTSW